MAEGLSFVEVLRVLELEFNCGGVNEGDGEGMRFSKGSNHFKRSPHGS